MKLWKSLNESDRLTLMLVLLLTVLSYAAILIIVALTEVTVPLWPVFMVTGWLFGAVMTFSFHKYRDNKSRS